jgi:TonB family protein
LRTAPITTTNFSRRNAAGFFHWENPGEPLAVHFHLNAVELLDRDASGAAENKVAAGILLGKRDDGPNPTLLVENYEPIPVALWKTTDSPFGDRRQLKAMIESWHSRPHRRMDVLGFYRSCAPGETKLTEDDLSVSAENSTQPESIFLLIEPRQGQPSNGYLYLAKDSAVTWEWKPTSFNRAELSGRGYPRRTEVRPSSPVRNDVPRIAEPPREVRTPVAMEPAGFNTRQWQWGIGILAVAALLAAGIFQYRGRVATNAPALKAALSADPSFGLKFERAGTDVRLTWNPEASSIMNAVGGQLIINDGPVSKIVNLDASDLRRGTIVYSPLTDDLLLKLQVNRQDSSAPLSESVRIVGGLPTATAAHAPVPGDASTAGDSQLAGREPDHTGISERDLQDIIRETSPSAALLPNRSNSISAGAKYDPSRPVSSGKPALRPQSRVHLPEDSLTVSKVLPSSGARAKARRPSRADRSMIAANSSGPAIASKPAEPVSPMSPVPMESIPVISAATPAAAFAPSVPRYVRRGGTVQPAQLLTNINPTYPVTAKQSGIAGSVEVHFKISNTGDVQNVVVVKGPQVLAQAAVDAVRERRYKPARVDGVPTETDASAIFDFKLN